MSDPSESTRVRLLVTAERLFALHGVDAVSLRQISVEAGQRNNSATQYHFGSKDALLRAIFTYRLEGLDARREAMVARLAAEGREGDLHGLVEAMVQPLAELVGSEGTFYVRFLARVHQHAGASVFALPAMGLEGSATRIGEMIHAALGHLPGPVRQSRLQLGGSLTVHAVADRAQRLEERPESEDMPAEAFTADLVDAVAGIFSAPVSQRVLDGLATTTPPVQGVS